MMADESSRARCWIAPLIILILAGASLGPTVGTPLRDADYVDLDLYSRFSPLDVFTTSHLRAERVHFYRPLSDFTDALMVRAYGNRPWAFHVTLLALIWVNALLLAGLAGRLASGARLAGWLAAAFYVVHPLQHGTLAYFEGGCAHITYLLFTLLFLHAALTWRERGGWRPALAVLGAGGAACLCFDGGLALPVGWLVLEILGLLPRVEGRGRRQRWIQRLGPLVVLAPVLAARKLVLGVFLGGYGLPLTRRLILEGPAAFVHVLGRIAYPAPPAVREAATLPVISPGVLALILALLLVLSLFADRKALKAALAVLALDVVLCLPALPDFVSQTIQRGEFPLSASYRLSVPIAMGSLVIALLLWGAARVLWARRPVAVLGAVVLLFSYGALGAPIGRANRLAGEIAEDVRRGVLDQTLGRKGHGDPETQPGRETQRRVFLVDTPLRVRLGNIVVMRIFQVGLASSLRPPALQHDIRAYPLVIDRAALILRPGATDLLARRDDVRMLRFDRDQRVVLPYRSTGVGPLPEIAVDEPDDGARVDLEDGSFRVVFDGSGVTHPVLILLNRVQPFYFSAAADPRAYHHLPLRPGGNGRVEARVGGPILREVLGHFPDDPLFFYIEDFDGKKASARSRVLKISVR